MSDACVSIHDFKRLEKKVNSLLIIHELDSMLTEKERKLVEVAETDIASRKKGKFVSLPGL